MTRFLFALAFFLGAAAVLWVGLGFVAGPPVALLATALIALVYGFGFLELLPVAGTYLLLYLAYEPLLGRLGEQSSKSRDFH